MDEEENGTKFAAILGSMIVLAAALFLVAISNTLSESESWLDVIDKIGSFVGGAGSVIAIIWLYAGIDAQMRELRHQRRDLKLQSESLKSSSESLTVQAILFAVPYLTESVNSISRHLVKSIMRNRESFEQVERLFEGGDHDAYSRFILESDLFQEAHKSAIARNDVLAKHYTQALLDTTVSIKSLFNLSPDGASSAIYRVLYERSMLSVLSAYADVALRDEEGKSSNLEFSE